MTAQMVTAWARIYAADRTLLLVCPIVDARMWGYLDGQWFFEYVFVDDAPTPAR